MDERFLPPLKLTARKPASFLWMGRFLRRYWTIGGPLTIASPKWHRRFNWYLILLTIVGAVKMDLATAGERWQRNWVGGLMRRYLSIGMTLRPSIGFTAL